MWGECHVPRFKLVTQAKLLDLDVGGRDEFAGAQARGQVLQLIHRTLGLIARLGNLRNPRFWFSVQPEPRRVVAAGARKKPRTLEKPGDRPTSKIVVAPEIELVTCRGTCISRRGASEAQQRSPSKQSVSSMKSTDEARQSEGCSHPTAK
jgi:hypothetical protein